MSLLRSLQRAAAHPPAPRRVRRLLQVSALVMPLAVLSATLAARYDAGFVRVDGPRLIAHGRPFRFVGANLAVMHDEPWRARYRDTMAAAAADGLTVGRIWALGEGARYAGAAEEPHLFRAGPDGWVEQSYVHLDRVLAEARRLHLRLIITLANNWPDYGGVPMYLRWAGIDPDSYDAKVRFFSDPQLRSWYRAHVARLVTRVNSVTGVRYRDDPTILSWELMNESMVFTPEGGAARRAWIVEMSRFLRARDPNHLISPGLLGYDTRRERQEWLRVMQLPEVDYCDAHLYPQENVHKLGSQAQIERAIDDVAQLARFVVWKPLIMGEFGFPAHVGPWEGKDRAFWFDVLLGRVLDDGAAGALAWVYEPWRGRGRRYGIYIDHEQSAAVRSVLGRHARRAQEHLPELRNPALTAARGAAPFLDQFVTVENGREPPAKWRAGEQGLELAIQPGDYTRAHWERTGSWDGGALVHVYGSETGFFEYRFTIPADVDAHTLVIRARLSSDFPGPRGPPDALSRVEVTIDGTPVASLLAIPDDGIGRWYEIAIADAEFLGRLRGSDHVLRFAVPDGPNAHGLAIYGPRTGKGDQHIEDAAPVTLRLAGGPADDLPAPPPGPAAGVGPLLR
jgi:mannan endo-1,4-beta-mannosidase